ncbi:MAG: hypothetical protein KH452_03350 [Clostridiales bacterium]|nr:hypothetical protein [Clostridiales bacterium]
MEELEVSEDVAEKRMRLKIPYVIILAASLLMMGRAFYGFDLTDESFYLAVTKRFAEGNLPFREEWFPTQLIGVLLLPLYSLYCWIHGSQEGIILFVRLCYVVFSGCIAVYLYYILNRIEKCDWKVSICAALLYLFYVRANIPTLSYYSIGLGTFLLFLLFRNRQSKICEFCSGVSFAISVLCMPYMLLYFIGILIKNIIAAIYKKKKLLSDGMFYLGIFVCAVVFLTYCFQSGNVVEIFENLPYILQDPEHQGTMFGSVTEFIWFMAGVFYKFLFVPMVMEFLAIGWWYYKKCKNDLMRRTLKYAAYLLFFVQTAYVRTFFEGGIIIVFLLMAVQLALLNRDFEKLLVCKYLIPGILFGIIWMLGSNVGQRVFNMGCVIAEIWAFQVVWKDIQNSYREERVIKCLAPCWVLGVVFLIRICDVYRDAELLELTVSLERGAGKGIYTTAERAEEYFEVLNKLEQYAGTGKVLAVDENNPWIYLEAPAECGVFAVWNVDFEDVRNEFYYEKYPEQVPDVIFLLNPEYGKYQGWRFSSHGSNTTGMGSEELCGWFKMLAEENEYQVYEEPCGKFYVRE